MTFKLIKVCLAIYYANFRKLTERRKSLTRKEKLEGDELLAKLKNNQIEYFLHKIIEMNDSVFNKEIEPLVCLSYIQVKDHPSKEHAKGLEALIRLLGNF